MRDAGAGFAAARCPSSCARTCGRLVAPVTSRGGRPVGQASPGRRRRDRRDVRGAHTVRSSEMVEADTSGVSRPCHRGGGRGMIGYYVASPRGTATSPGRSRSRPQLRGEPVSGLSSRPRPDGWQGSWLSLTRDDAPSPSACRRGPVTAGGALALGAVAATPASGNAWPRSRRGWRRTRRACMVVDVSVEVAVLARTMGVPTVVMGMPGARDDRPHQLAFRLADAIIAPWPAWAPCSGRCAVADEDPRRRRDLTLRRSLP